MPIELRLSATVLPGHRVEFAAPELPVGERVELVVTLSPRQVHGNGKPNAILAFLDSLPPNKKSAEEWEQFDREFKEEKRSWVL